MHSLSRNEPMRRHTSWRVGGPADLYYRPATVIELQDFLRSTAADTPITWIGLGSNVLVRDGGVRGVVIATGSLDKRIERITETRVSATAGVTCASFARQCARWQLGPATFFAGIPGSIGGALAMNAGAFGGETWESIVTATTIDRDGRLRERAKEDFAIAYRRVTAPDGEWFVAAAFEFSATGPEDKLEIRRLLAQRAETQPVGKASCGSVFRNPPGDFAGRLIESAGLKGFRRGAVAVSDKHANFIVHEGNASAADIEALILFVQGEVERRTGILLEPEVRILGQSELGAD